MPPTKIQKNKVDCHGQKGPRRGKKSKVLLLDTHFVCAHVVFGCHVATLKLLNFGDLIMMEWLFLDRVTFPQVSGIVTVCLSVVSASIKKEERKKNLSHQFDIVSVNDHGVLVSRAPGEFNAAQCRLRLFAQGK